MKASEILMRCLQAPADVRRIEKSIQQRRDAMYAITPPAMDKSSGGRGTPDPDKPGRLLGDISDLEQRREARKQEQDAEIAAVCRLLDALTETESAIVHGFYIMHLSLATIARAECYSDGYVRSAKKNAVNKLDTLPESQIDALLPAWYLQREKERNQ